MTGQEVGTEAGSRIENRLRDCERDSKCMEPSDSIQESRTVLGSWQLSGSYPLQLQGRPTCPGGRDTRKEGGVEAELTQPLAGREAHKTKQNQGSQVDSAPRWSREEPDQEACLKMEAERQGQPLVIDKTKEYKRVSTL